MCIFGSRIFIFNRKWTTNDIVMILQIDNIDFFAHPVAESFCTFSMGFW